MSYEIISNNNHDDGITFQKRLVLLNIFWIFFGVDFMEKSIKFHMCLHSSIIYGRNLRMIELCVCIFGLYVIYVHVGCYFGQRSQLDWDIYLNDGKKSMLKIEISDTDIVTRNLTLYGFCQYIRTDVDQKRS